MNDLKSSSDRADEAVLYFELSDDVLEIAGGTPATGLATLLNTYCFTCPAGEDWGSRASGVAEMFSPDSVLNPRIALYNRFAARG
jgi:hypothetical protein